MVIRITSLIVILSLITLVLSSSTSSHSKDDHDQNNNKFAMRRLIRDNIDKLRIYPPRVGRNYNIMLGGGVITNGRNKRAADLASFPRIGRATNLQAFPRLGRAPAAALTNFPRVGRNDLSWCTDCSDDMIKQLVRRVMMPPRVGRSQSFMLARPRVGKRFEGVVGSGEVVKRQKQGLSIFPRVGRSDIQLEYDEDPTWFADTVLEKRNKAEGNLWFGPRLGRKKRDLQDQPLDNSIDYSSLYQYILTAPVPIEYTDNNEDHHEKNTKNHRGSTATSSNDSSNWTSDISQ